jgi:hypothetical protein
MPLLLVLVSCKDDDDIGLQNSNESTSRFIADSITSEKILAELSLKPQRTKTDARKIAKAFIKEISGTLLRSDEFEVNGIATNNGSPLYELRGETTKIKPVDTFLYLLNMRNNAGFLIISGDKRMPDVLAYSDKGNLYWDSIPEPSGLSLFIKSLPKYYELQRINRFRDRDRLPRLGDFTNPDHGKDIVKVVVIGYKYSDWYAGRSVKPLVPVKWGQDYPYNNEAKEINGKHAVTGCVATAIAQLCAAHKYPKYYKGISLDWDLLTAKPNIYGYTATEQVQYEKQVALFLRKIGDALDNDWGENITSANPHNIGKVLDELGYKSHSDLLELDTHEILNNLNNRFPVLVGGAEGYPYKHGHRWICDGYLTRIQDKIRIEQVEERRGFRRWREVIVGKYYSHFLHCNWGWDGYCDGYFYSGVFNAKDAYLYDKDIRSKPSNEFYFRYGLTNILDIHY